MDKLGHNTIKWRIKIFLSFSAQYFLFLKPHKYAEFWSEKHEKKNNYNKCCTNVSSSSSFLWNVQNWVRVQHARFNFFSNCFKNRSNFLSQGQTACTCVVQGSVPRSVYIIYNECIPLMQFLKSCRYFQF